MNQRTEMLTQLLEIKIAATNKAKEALNLANMQREHSQTRQSQLCGYKQDYLRQLENLKEGSGQIGQLRNRIDFINQLDAALAQLNTHLAMLVNQCNTCESVYKKTKLEQDAVNKLIEKAQALEMLKGLRKEQKGCDEHAQKQWVRRQTITETDAANE
jgi:flagellar FliJ protein